MHIDGNELNEFSEQHRTDPRIVKAIYKLARDEAHALLIWFNPLPWQIDDICRDVGPDALDLQWGSHTLHSMIHGCVPNSSH